MRSRVALIPAVLAIAVLAWSPKPARAADSDVAGEFGLFAGLSRADADLVGSGKTDTSPLFGLRWAVRLNRRWNWFADGDYMQHDTPLIDDSDIFEGRTGFEALFPVGGGNVNWFLAGALGATEVNYPQGLKDFSRPLLSLGIGLAHDGGGLRGEVRAEQLLGDNGVGGADITNFQVLVGYSFGLKRREEQGAARPLFRKGETKLTLEGVNFEFDSARLTHESYSKLDRVAASLRAHPKVRVEISGHTDEMGTPEYNMTLSRQRAEAVRDYLMSKGVSGSRLEAKGYGETEPLAPNTSEEGRSKNRRVELKRLED
jgi:outer membrane protein OmpA-like peptidoglycan-associated protein